MLKLLADVGRACAQYQHNAMRGLTIKKVQVDGIWSFIGMKQKNVLTDDVDGSGNCYTFTAIDPETKLMPCWLVGTRSRQCAYDFTEDLASRLAVRVQLTTDGLKVYGNPDEDHISTSHVERANLSMRMGMRRFTTLTNAFSRKLERHMHAVSFYFMVYNFVKTHKTIKATPAMEAGVTTCLWTMENIVMMSETLSQK